MDDGTVGNESPLTCWEDTVEALKCVLRQGLPVNIKKCKLLQRSLDLLGVTLTGDHYHLGQKAIARLITSHLPRTLSEL